MLFDPSPQLAGAKLALKSFAIVALAAGAFYAAWSWRSTIAEKEERDAVDSAIIEKVEAIDSKLDVEREERRRFKEQMETVTAQMSSKLASIQYTSAQVKTGIEAERKANKEFYQQPIPDGGRALWLKAREAVTGPAPSASAPR